MSAKFSIRYKFLAVTTFLLALCVGTYLLLASYIFKQDKQALVFDYNRSLVVNLSSELETFFGSVSDKMQLAAHFQHKKDQASQKFLKQILLQSQDLVWLGSSENLKEIGRSYFVQDEFLKTYALPEDYFEKEITKIRSIPFEDLRRTGEVYWNATSPDDGPALIGVAKTVLEEDERGIPVGQFAIISFVKADRILKALKLAEPNQMALVNEQGQILVHGSIEKMRSAGQFSEVQLKMAKESAAKTQVVRFDMNGEPFFGAHSKSLGERLLIFSSVPERLAFGAVNDLVSRSILFGSILVTLAFLLAIGFSRSLTRPIEVLVGGMNQVSKGNLETQIVVNSQDEIASLAKNFNLMIQDLKSSRAALEEVNRDLESKVQERTKQLEERNLAVKEAQEALLRSTRLAAVGEVAGLAAHEVLNPLTSMISRVADLKDRITAVKDNEAQFLIELQGSWDKDFKAGGFSKLVKAWQEPSKALGSGSLWDEDLQNIKSVGEGLKKDFDGVIKDAEFLMQESQRISRIVNSFRSLSSVKAEVKPHHIHELCDKSIEIMTDLAAKNKIQIKKEFFAENDQVLVDEDEIIQVLTNLLRNAIQATAERTNGLKEIKVSTSVEDQSFVLRISDTGCGINEDNKKKLFVQKFTTKNKDEGTGLGLSLSRRLIRAFKGDLVLQSSDVEKGSVFKIRLPLDKSFVEGRSA